MTTHRYRRPRWKRSKQASRRARDSSWLSQRPDGGTGVLSSLVPARRPSRRRRSEGAQSRLRRANGARSTRPLERIVFAPWRDCPIPVIAAVNGQPMRADLELLLHCEFCLCFVYGEVCAHRRSPWDHAGRAAERRRARVVGERRAKELILGGPPVLRRRKHLLGGW